MVRVTAVELDERSTLLSLESGKADFVRSVASLQAYIDRQVSFVHTLTSFDHIQAISRRDMTNSTATQAGAASTMVSTRSDTDARSLADASRNAPPSRPPAHALTLLGGSKLSHYLQLDRNELQLEVGYQKPEDRCQGHG